MAQILQVLIMDELLDEEYTDEEDVNVIPPLTIDLASDREDIPKVSGFSDLILQIYSNTEFKRDFRIHRETFESVLNTIGPLIAYENRPNGRPPLSPEKQLLIFIWYLSNQDSMREIGRLFGVTKFTIHRCVRRVSEAVCNSMMKTLISWPDDEEQEAISRRIEDSSHVAGVVGYIDGTHIRLSHVPGGDNDYVNRKGFPSLQLQLVVNDKMVIMDAYVGWPGSVHDARVYRNSPIFHDLQHDRHSGIHIAEDRFLIGDAAYPLSSFMMTPFRQTGRLTSAQKFYNKKVSSIRQTVERTIGHLKQRFRRLRDLYCMQTSDCCHLIMSACILHNLCVFTGDELSGILEVNFGARVNNYPAVYRDHRSGIEKRNRLVEYLYNCCH